MLSCGTAKIGAEPLQLLRILIALQIGLKGADPRFERPELLEFGAVLIAHCLESRR